jgi:hypothetical protein
MPFFAKESKKWHRHLRTDHPATGTGVIVLAIF